MSTVIKPRSHGRRTSVLSLFIALLLSTTWIVAKSATADSRLTSSQIPSAVHRSAITGRLKPSAKLSFDILLPYRNQTELDSVLHRLYTPTDPLYRHYLTPAQFKAEYGPSDDTVQRLKEYVSNNGLSIADVAKNNSYVRVSGRADLVESLLNVHFVTHTDAVGRTFYAPDSEPTVPVEIEGMISGFAGLTNQSAGRPQYIRTKMTPGTGGTKPTLNFTGANGVGPSDIQKLYGFNNSTYNGAGETVAVFEQGTFYPSDPAAYDSAYGLPSQTYDPVSVDGFDTDPTVNIPDPNGNEIEVDLDLELWSALAPGVKAVKVYENDDSTATPFITEVIDSLNLMANDPTGLASVISISYDESEQYDITATESAAENAQLEQLAAQGQTVTVSSGDDGAFDYYQVGNVSAMDPGVQPLVTSVGGTDLFDTATEQYEYESTWADAPATGGGGGISAYWTIPSYQVGAFTKTSDPQGSTINRNEPDVSLFADPTNYGYSEYEYDQLTSGNSSTPWISVGGTSASAPLWAAYFADVDQALQAEGQPPIGFANPVIYKVAESANYASDFNDITIGNNLLYNAGPGYDNATGWGSFKGSALFLTLISQPSIQTFSPTAVAVNSGNTVVTLTGANLSGATAATWNGNTLTNLSVSGSTLTATIPSTDLTAVAAAPIYVTTPAGSASTSIPFTVYGPPTITGVNPASGNIGQTITVLGTGFVNVTNVTLNGVSVTPTIESPTALTFIIPQTASTGPIVVTTPLGTATSASFTIGEQTVVNHLFPTFSYLSDPNSSSEIVYITGTGLSKVTDVVYEGQDIGMTDGFQIEDDGLVEAAINTSLIGTASGAIKLITPTGNVYTTNYHVLANPTVTAISPTTVAVGGELKITGTNLNGITSVTFANGTLAVPSLLGATTLTLTVPPGAASGPVTLHYPGPSLTSAISVTVLAVPTVISFSPTTTDVNKPITITGTNLTGATLVTFGGGATAVPSTVTATKVTVLVPMLAMTGPVSVQTAGGIGTSEFALTVIGIPVIASISPTAGLPGTTITFTGANLTGTTTVTFTGGVNGIAVNASAVTATSVSAVVPPGATTGPITVTTPGGTATSPTFTILSISNFHLNAPTVIFGTAISGRVTLNVSAPAGGTVVQLSSNSAILTSPASVTIPAGSDTNTFSLTAAAPGTATVTATLGSSTAMATITIAQTIANFHLSVSTAVLGDTVSGRVTLTANAPAGGTVVDLMSSSSGASVPATLTIPAGLDTATFPVTLVAPGSATITATLGTSTATATLTVSQAIANFHLALPTATAGTTDGARVTLAGNAPVGGTVVTLSSNSPSATVPASITVPAGTDTQTFSVAAVSAGTATITATLGASSATASLTVNN